jgi:hypothetical protein
MSAPVSSTDAEVSAAVDSKTLRSVKKPAVLEDVGVPTEEARMKAMLGYVDESQANIYNREDFCGACGIQHPNYPLLDTYPLCESCLNCLREQSHLRKRYEGTVQDTSLEICFATYGKICCCFRSAILTIVIFRRSPQLSIGLRVHRASAELGKRIPLQRPSDFARD